MALSALTHAIE